LPTGDALRGQVHAAKRYFHSFARTYPTRQPRAVQIHRIKRKSFVASMAYEVREPQTENSITSGSRN